MVLGFVDLVIPISLATALIEGNLGLAAFEAAAYVLKPVKVLGWIGKGFKRCSTCKRYIAKIVNRVIKGKDVDVCEPPKLTSGTIAPRKSGGETQATRAGRQAHKDWNPGEGYTKEVTLPSGKRADAVNLELKHVKELKPNNRRAVRRGEKQVEEYRQELQREHGGNWTSSVETY